MTKDGDILLRVLQYGFHYAFQTISDTDAIQFPEPLIVYLYDRQNYLYHHIYDKYDELVSEGVSEMAEEALIFDVDILEHRIKELEKTKELLQNNCEELKSNCENLKNDNLIWESAKQSLQSENHMMKTQLQSLVNLLMNHMSAEEAAAQTGLSLEEILEMVKNL